MVLAPDVFYEAANLRGNPFRSTPTQSSDPRIDIWVGYERQQRQLVKFLQRTRCDQVGNTNFIMLFGTWGTGKSHALLWAQNRILHIEKEEYNSVCYFMPTLKKGKGGMTFAGAFVEDLVERSTILADVRGFKQFLRSCATRYRDDHHLSVDVTDEDIVESLYPTVELYNFAREVLRCEDEDDFRQLLAPKGLTDYQAVVLFTRLVNLFVSEVKLPSGSRRFKKGAYLFVDEVDDLLRVPVKEARAVNDAFRHLYDACPNCFCLAIALSAEIAEFSAMFETYVLSRIQRRIEMSLLDKDDAVRFIQAILESWRHDPSGPRGSWPFEDAAVEAIASHLTEITPRKIVNVMQQVIEEVRLHGHNPADGPISLSILDEADILDEVLGQGSLS